MKAVLLVCLILLSLGVSAQPGKSPAGPQFTFLNPRARDLGNVLLNANTTVRFEFKNTGNQPLLIKSMSGSPKGLNSPNYKILMSYPESPIRPGDMAAIEITFVAQGDTGNFRNTIMITSNATGPNYPVSFTLQGILQLNTIKPHR